MAKQIISPVINLEFIPIIFKHEQRELEGVQFKRSKGKRAYFTGIKNNMRMCEVIKTMQFDDESNKIFISFGKRKIEIGSYTIETL